VLDKRQWVPGAWCDADALACSSYYPHFAPYLLNGRHRITTAVEATQDQASVFSEFGQAGQVFVRPDGCQKTFTGRVVSEDDFASALTPARYDPATRIVIAEPRPISREWRLIIVEGTVVGVSQYLVGKEIRTESGCPGEILSFAVDMLNAVPWRPDAAFMADVCQSEGNLFLLELNGFSSSAVYPCDYAAVVAAVSDLAVRTWQRRRDQSNAEDTGSAVKLTPT
jgi:hypothetical protein